MSRMGARWRRRFNFHLPVRRPDLWTSPEINGALIDALSFLSEDTFFFTFEQFDHAIRRQPS